MIIQNLRLPEAHFQVPFPRPAFTERLTTPFDGFPALKLHGNLLSRNQVITVEGRLGINVTG